MLEFALQMCLFRHVHLDFSPQGTRSLKTFLTFPSPNCLHSAALNQLLHAQEATLQSVEAAHVDGKHEGLLERGADLDEALGSSRPTLQENGSEDGLEGMLVVDTESGLAEESSEEAELEGIQPEDLDGFDRDVESWLVRLTLYAHIISCAQDS